MVSGPKPTLLGRWIAPWPLLLGAVVSFLACCGAGFVLSRTNCYQHFERFHPFISYLTLHYPTVAQVRSLGRSRLDPDKIIVVVGGNSVLYGSGTSPSDLWTRKLQESLGDQYQVINFGMCGAGAQEFGATAAEVLSRDYPKMIFITNTWFEAETGFGSPDGRPVTRYFYWEAYYKHWLVPDPNRDAWASKMLNDEKDGSFLELKTMLVLDQTLGFRDLWTTLEYTHFNTTWRPEMSATWMEARRIYSDPTTTSIPPPSEAKLPALKDAEFPGLRDRLAGYRSYVRSAEADAERERAGVRRTSVPDAKERSVQECFPETFRPHMLMLISLHCPYLVNQLTPDEKAAYFEASARTAAFFESTGMTAVEIGKDYPDGSFIDHVHLSAEGGRRMAEEASRQVRQMARRLRYTEGGNP
jgi:hypothetical protein